MDSMEISLTKDLTLVELFFIRAKDLFTGDGGDEY
jgi:hypothetical protein